MGEKEDSTRIWCFDALLFIFTISIFFYGQKSFNGWMAIGLLRWGEG